MCVWVCCLERGRRRRRGKRKKGRYVREEAVCLYVCAGGCDCTSESESLKQQLNNRRSDAVLERNRNAGLVNLTPLTHYGCDCCCLLRGAARCWCCCCSYASGYLLCCALVFCLQPLLCLSPLLSVSLLSVLFLFSSVFCLLSWLLREADGADNTNRERHTSKQRERENPWP